MASRTSLNKQNSKSARAAHVCFISLPSLHDYGMNFSNVTFYGGSKLFLSLSVNLGVFPKDSPLGVSLTVSRWTCNIHGKV